jgi:hypothetical protein
MAVTLDAAALAEVKADIVKLQGEFVRDRTADDALALDERHGVRLLSAAASYGGIFSDELGQLVNAAANCRRLTNADLERRRRRDAYYATVQNLLGVAPWWQRLEAVLPGAQAAVRFCVETVGEMGALGLPGPAATQLIGLVREVAELIGEHGDASTARGN